MPACAGCPVTDCRHDICTTPSSSASRVRCPHEGRCAAFQAVRCPGQLASRGSDVDSTSCGRRAPCWPGSRPCFAPVWAYLPEGRPIPGEVWDRRHAVIVKLVWLHAGGLLAASILLGDLHLEGVVGSIVIGVLAAVGRPPVGSAAASGLPGERRAAGVVGGDGPPVGRRHRDALPLLRGAGDHRVLPGLGRLPGRHRVRAAGARRDRGDLPHRRSTTTRPPGTTRGSGPASTRSSWPPPAPRTCWAGA